MLRVWQSRGPAPPDLSEPKDREGLCGTLASCASVSILQNTGLATPHPAPGASGFTGPLQALGSPVNRTTTLQDPHETHQQHRI